MTDLEYIVIDGGSKDGTHQIIEKYRSHISYTHSKPDRGIYDAMNKGLAVATGEWVNFLNAGDTYHSPQTLSKLMAKANPATEVLYGNYIIAYPTFKKNKICPTNLANLYQGMCLNHQSMCYKTLVAKQFPYSLDYKLAADYHQTVSLYYAGRAFQYVEDFIAVFEDGGVSAQRKIEYLNQCEKAILLFEPAHKIRPIYQHLRAKHLLIGKLKQFLPPIIFGKLMQLKNRLIG